MSYTANSGYPPCPSEWGDGGAPAIAEGDNKSAGAHNGIFTVRIWGNFCIGGGITCHSLKDDGARALLSSRNILNLTGYGATFRPAGNCGPARWPTPELRAAGAPAYAEWCDVTVDVRRVGSQRQVVTIQRRP